MYRCRLWCCIFTKFCRWTSGRLTIGLLFVLSLLALLTALQNDVTYIWLWRFVCEHSSGRIARAIPAHLQAFCVYIQLTSLTTNSVSQLLPRSPQHLSARRQQQTECTTRPPCYRTSRLCTSRSSTVWNSLPDNLRNSTVGPDQFQRELKTHLFACLLNISSRVR